MDSVIAALGAGRGENSPYNKASVATTAGRWYSFWTAAGLPTAGATPSTGAGDAPTNATTGALKFTNASGSNKKYGLRLAAGSPTAGVVQLIDRLVTTSGLSGTNTGVQTVNTTALTRRTDAVGVLCALEVYTAIGATPQTATILYTNSDGVAARSGTISILASAQAGSFILPMTMQAGDVGVQSVQSVQLGGSTGTAGNFGVTLFYPIATLGYNANEYTERDLVLQTSNLPELKTASCLGLIALATTTATGIVFGEVGMAEG